MVPSKGRASAATPTCHECLLGAPSGTFLWDRHTRRLYFWCWSCARELRIGARLSRQEWREVLGETVDDDAPVQGRVRERSEDLGV